MKVDAFDFDLPEEQIALRPVEPRDAARMLVVEPDRAPHFTDSTVRDLADWLGAGDVLVLNDTRVIPARLFGQRLREGATGARIECLLHQRLDDNRWTALARPAKRLKPQDLIRFAGAGEACYADTLNARVEAVEPGGIVTLAFELTGPFLDSLIAAHGEMPLPPYIAGRRTADARDMTDYQTVYARQEGAVAAPTAGLHFTGELLQSLVAEGVEICHVTLHVGAGTFLPVKAEDTDDHRMHAEWGEISEATARKINETRATGGRVVAAGTTSLRLLESAARCDGSVEAFSDSTDIFITPGYRFKTVDVLLTNFHLPRSTLFMLVSAFCGLDVMQAAYTHAIGNGYRFYSYGDCCLLHAKGEA